MEKIMEIFIQNVLANSIPIGILYVIAKNYLQRLKKRFEMHEDKIQAMSKVLLNGNYEEYLKEYDRLQMERDKLNNS